MNQALCRAILCRPDEFGGPRQAEPQRPLCHLCAERLGPNLKRLAAIWPDLRARVAVDGRPGEKVSGSRSPGLVINEQVSDLSREIDAWARSVVAYVLDAHTHADIPPAASTPRLLSWLGRYHAWRLAYADDHDIAVGAVDWAAWYRREMRRLAYPSGARRFDIPDARCREPFEADDGSRSACGGQLYAIVRDDSSLLPSEIICDSDDEHRIPSGRWVQYMRRLERDKHATE